MSAGNHRAGSIVPRQVCQSDVFCGVVTNRQIVALHGKGVSLAWDHRHYLFPHSVGLREDCRRRIQVHLETRRCRDLYVGAVAKSRKSLLQSVNVTLYCLPRIDSLQRGVPGLEENTLVKPIFRELAWPRRPARLGVSNPFHPQGQVSGKHVERVSVLPNPVMKRR